MIWLLFIQKKSRGGAISVTERRCAAPISKVDSHRSVGLDINIRIFFEIFSSFRDISKFLGYLEKFIAFFGCFPAFPRYFLDRILSVIILC